jgi:DNA-binding NarL/FixJ family response regulator
MSTGAGSSAARILIASADLELSQLRKQVIEQQLSKLEVVCTRNRQHALALLQSENYHVLLLCNSLTQKARAEFAAIYRQRNPAGRIVVIEGRERPPFAYDLMLPSPLAPTELIGAMRGLLLEIEAN